MEPEDRSPDVAVVVSSAQRHKTYDHQKCALLYGLGGYIFGQLSSVICPITDWERSRKNGNEIEGNKRRNLKIKEDV